MTFTVEIGLKSFYEVRPLFDAPKKIVARDAEETTYSFCPMVMINAQALCGLSTNLTTPISARL